MCQIHPINISVQEASRILGILPTEVLDRCRRGLISSTFDGPQRVVNFESLRQYAASLPAERPVTA